MNSLKNENGCQGKNLAICQHRAYACTVYSDPHTIYQTSHQITKKSSVIYVHIYLLMSIIYRLYVKDYVRLPLQIKLFVLLVQTFVLEFIKYW